MAIKKIAPHASRMRAREPSPTPAARPTLSPAAAGNQSLQRLLHVRGSIAPSAATDRSDDPIARDAESVDAGMRLQPLRAPVASCGCAEDDAPCPACSAGSSGPVQRRASARANNRAGTGAVPVYDAASRLGRDFRRVRRHPSTHVAEDRNGLPARLRTNLEVLSGFDLADVRVHRNSPWPARVDAVAFAQGRHIHLAPGEDRHLPHESWHVVQQRQGRVRRSDFRVNDVAINDDPRLESEADRMGARALQPPPPPPPALLRGLAGASSAQPAQREVRIDGGRRRVNEAEYQRGGGKASVGSLYSVARLIGDSERRVFTSATELENYANGQTDYIGLVRTQLAGRFWYRLPANRLTVLGESHENPRGNVEDVILGVRTSRFMYEPFNEFADVAPFTQANIGTGTRTRLAQVHSGLRVAGRVDRTNFNPDLENIVIKALAGAAITRNEFIAANPPRMNAAQRQEWSARASTSDYSYGERTALYLSYAIHLAQDIAQHTFGRRSARESAYERSARRLVSFYQSHQSELDLFVRTKDADDLIGIYELTSPHNFRNLSVLRRFTLVFHEFAARYIEQLGRQSGNAALQSEGRSLARNRRADLDDLSPAREEIMWQRIQYALAHRYLIVGMGDAHRQNLQPRLRRAGIRNEEVESALAQQQADVNAHWVVSPPRAAPAPAPRPAPTPTPRLRLPLRFGLSGGATFFPGARPGADPTWYARFYVGTEFQHPVLGLFNPTLGIGVSAIGESATRGATPLTSPTSALVSLLPGLRFGPRGDGLSVSLFGGPALAINRSDKAIGAEAGAALGYRWRWLDVSLGTGYAYDPTRQAGMEHGFTLGANLTFIPFEFAP